MANDAAGRGPAKADNTGAPVAATPADVAVVVVDRQWRVTSVRAGTRFAPIAGGLLDCELLKARPEFAGTELYTRLVEAMSARTAVRLEGYYAPLGAWVAVSAGPTEEGGMAIFCQDVTSRRSAEEECARLQSIIESSGDAIVAVDADGRVTNWNAAAERTYGHGAVEILGRAFADLVASESRPAAAGALGRVLAASNGHVERVELTQVARGGRQLEVAATLAPIRDPAGQVAGASIVARDITDQKRAERLRDEKERLESAGAAKDQFLAVLSHELRTPLTPVLMSAGSLEQDSTLPQSVRDEITAIRRNVELEARLIDDLLDLNRITRGKLQLDLQAADVHSLIGHALYVAREDILSKRIWLRMELGATRYTVRADPVRLQQVFWNLLKNAVKFTPAGGTLVVRSVDRDGVVRVEVQDSGIGIESAALGRIFNAFEQVGAPQNHGPTGSLGLGLTICRALVELHGGRIWAESAGPGRGATFVVELPAVVAGATVPVPALTPPVAANASEAKRLVILVVEDHAGTAQMLGKILTGFGHEVETAANFREASAASASRRFDLVISDLGLPDGSGLDLMRQVRTHDPDVRGIALSGYGMEEDVRKSAAAGFAAHLTKPVAVQQLKSVIARVTGAVLPEPSARLYGAPRSHLA